MPGSCSNGLRSRPSIAGGSSRTKGLEANSRNARKPALIAPITASTRATAASGSCRLHADTASDHRPSISVHSSIEPSCPPQTAAMRYASGSALLALAAT
ncbi:hypothetical protein D9M72_281060 [compost metagenome]